VAKQKKKKNLLIISIRWYDCINATCTEWLWNSCFYDQYVLYTSNLKGPHSLFIGRSGVIIVHKKKCVEKCHIVPTHAIICKM